MENKIKTTYQKGDWLIITASSPLLARNLLSDCYEHLLFRPIVIKYVSIEQDETIIYFKSSSDKLSDSPYHAKSTSCNFLHIEPPTTRPLVGDKIIATDSNDPRTKGRIFIVTKLDDMSDMVFAEDYLTNSWFDAHNYQILQREEQVTKELCQECGGKGEIELFTSTVKCQCLNR